MGNKLQLFEYQGQDVRVVWLEDKAWYILADICKILNLGNPAQVSARLKKDGIRICDTVDSLGRKQEMLCVDMPNYLRAIMRAHKSKDAELFQDWVCEEVLPAILKTGSYSMHGPNFQSLVELDPCDVKDNTKLLRRVVMFYEDVILGAQKKLDLYKGLEEHYHPEQARPRGRRDVHPINVYRTDENTTHLVFGVFEKEIVVQTTLIFED